eukprot:scaffold7275_cov61-Phaeocystis_antarctica.AAC.4
MRRPVDPNTGTSSVVVGVAACVCQCPATVDIARLVRPYSMYCSVPRHRKRRVGGKLCVPPGCGRRIGELSSPCPLARREHLSIAATHHGRRRIRRQVAQCISHELHGRARLCARDCSGVE